MIVWIGLGLTEQFCRLALAAYDRVHGLELDHLAIDGCIHQGTLRRPGRRQESVDRGEQGLKRSVATDARGIPLGCVPAPANHREDRLLGATLDTLDSAPCRSTQGSFSRRGRRDHHRGFRRGLGRHRSERGRAGGLGPSLA